MAGSQIDRDKLRVHLRRLRKDQLLSLLDQAIELVPRTRLPGLIEGSISLSELGPDAPTARRLLQAVEAFGDASLRGEYYEDFDVNSKNFMEQSRGTQTWIAECNRLFGRCVKASLERPNAEVCQAFEVLFGLLRHIDDAPDDVVFFADEAGSWQVGVNWEEVLPPYFASLAATAEADTYASAVASVVDDFVGHDHSRYLRAARAAANPDQKKALRALGRRA